MSSILSVQNITKKYGDFTAVSDVSFEVKRGEVVGLLGPNGAGKTTTIHMILSLLTPTEGKIKIFGNDITERREEILEKVNFVAPYAELPHNLTVLENLTVFSLLYGVRKYKEKINELLADFKLNDFRKKKAGDLSSGERTRLGLAKAFLNDPKFLILDEPTASLDPDIARSFREIIWNRMRELGGAILWTSHNMKEVETMCSRIIFLVHGRIVADGTPANLREEFGQEDLEEVFISIVKKSEETQHI